jgi:hypothetical protein
MSRYARQTTVPIERSKAEIERTLARYGASHFGYVSEPGTATIAFRAHGRAIRMRLALPAIGEFKKDRRGRARAPSAAEKELDRAVKQRWRALALVIKAKLEAIESGIATFDDEWLPYTVLPDGRTVAETVVPQLGQLEAGAPLLLAMGPS